MAVQQAGQLRDRCVGSRRRPVVEEQVVGQHRDPERRRQTRARSNVRHALQRRSDRRMASRVHLDSAGGRLEGARELDQSRGFFRRQRNCWIFHVEHVDYARGRRPEARG